jgi:uncharacterized cupin superfamily protein
MNQVLVESDPSPMKLEIMGAEEWPLLIHAPGTYQHCVSATESSYIVEGNATVVSGNALPVTVSEGDLLTIMPDTECVWTITKAIHRHCDSPQNSFTNG